MTNNLNNQYIQELKKFEKFTYIKKVFAKKKNENYTSYFDTIVKNLDSNESGQFLTKNLYTKLEGTLGTSSEFKKLSSFQKSELQTKLDELNYKEYAWKSAKKFTHDPSLASKVNLESQKKFHILLSAYKNPSEEDLKGQRSYTHFFNHKIKTFLIGFANFIQSQNTTLEVFNNIKHFNNNDIRIISEKYLFNSWIFSEIVKLAYKKAHDNIFSRDAKISSSYYSKVSDNVLTLNKVELMYSFGDIFALLIINASFNFMAEYNMVHLSDEDLASIEFECLSAIKKKQFNYKHSRGNDFWGVHMDNTRIIVDFVEECKFYKYITKAKALDNKAKTNIKYVLHEAPDSMFVPVTEFPRVQRPKSLKLNQIDFLIKPMIFGEGSVSKSKTLLKTLNVSQAKKFKINITCLALLEEFFKREIFSVFTALNNCGNSKLPISSTKTFLESQKDFESLNVESIYGTPEKYVSSSIKNNFIGNSFVNISHNQLLAMVGITKIERYMIQAKKKSEQKLTALLMKDRFALTVIELARIFVGFPIYISDMLCLRLRLYPKQPLISRTSGDYKYLLCDYNPISVSEQGIVSMLESYYAPNKNQLCKFISYKQTYKSKSQLFDFFLKNPLDFTCLKKVLYFSLLHIEIHKTFKSERTDFTLEIDQNSSGVTFLAFVLRNKKLAEVSGLIPDSNGLTHSEGPYIYCLKNFKTFYDSEFESKNERVFHLFNTDKKVHKYAMMCFCYSQTHIGRMDDFVKRFTEFYDQAPTEEERATLFEFALKYLSFQDYLFPGLKSQMQLLKDLVEISAKEKGEVSVRTLEGEVLTWSFYAYTSQTRTTIDPFTKKPKKFKLKRFLLEDSEQKSAKEAYGTEVLESVRRKKIDINSFKKNFLVYLIHSIDAAVMRYFIRVMFEKYRYRINHLHDCVLIHPNYVDCFYQEVIDLYSSDEIYDMINTLVFDQIRSNLSTDSQIELDNIRKAYFANSEDFKSLISINPKILYSPEN